MNQSAYEHAVAYARSFLAQHFAEDNHGRFQGIENFTVQCDEIKIPQEGSLAYDEKKVVFSDIIPFDKIKEQKDPTPTKQRIFVIGIGEKVAHENGAKSGSFFLKVQLTNEDKVRPVTVVIVGSKRMHCKTEKFQELLGDKSNPLLNFPLGEWGRIIRVVAEIYGIPPVDRQIDSNGVV